MWDRMAAAGVRAGEELAREVARLRTPLWRRMQVGAGRGCGWGEWVELEAADSQRGSPATLPAAHCLASRAACCALPACTHTTPHRAGASGRPDLCVLRPPPCSPTLTSARLPPPHPPLTPAQLDGARLYGKSEMPSREELAALQPGDPALSLAVEHPAPCTLLDPDGPLRRRLPGSRRVRDDCQFLSVLNTLYGVLPVPECVAPCTRAGGWAARRGGRVLQVSWVADKLGCMCCTHSLPWARQMVPAGLTPHSTPSRLPAGALTAPSPAAGSSCCRSCWPATPSLRASRMSRCGRSWLSGGGGGSWAAMWC